MPQNESIESRKDFKNTPEGQYKYWLAELKSFSTRMAKWTKQGTKIVEKFKGGIRTDSETNDPSPNSSGFRLNLFHSNVITLQSMMYGNLPKVDVGRRYSDPNDDIGRVAGLILERALNCDVQDNGKEYNTVLRSCLQDRLLPGLGCARVRYTFDETTEMEDAPIDYYHWRDVAWGWARNFSDLPWIAYRSYLTKDEVSSRFGEEFAEKVELKDQSVAKDDDSTQLGDDAVGPWLKAEIWEIWDKANKKIVWVSLGCDKVLDTKDDFLNLSGFFPCPPFLMANVTTSLYVPTPDYHLAQDLYNEIDTLQTRISVITEAVKVVGVFDASQEEIARMFDEGIDNDLIPVSKWAMFAEKGGLNDTIEWFPIKDVIEALSGLREIRDETIGLLQQVTGMSDVMRGDLKDQYEGVGQSQLKAKFGSVRVQAMQDEFANFAGDLLQLKAEVISRHFSPQSIARMANLDSTFDQDLLPEAMNLVKNPEMSKFKVKIRPESVAMVDYAQLKEERSGYITALATFMQSAAPLMESDPNAKPYLLHLLKWGLAGYKGSTEIEGVLDKAIQASMEEAGQDKPDPEKERQGMAMELEKVKHQNAIIQIQAKSKADLLSRQADSQADLQKIRAELMAELKEIQAKMVADIRTELSTSEINAEQQVVSTQGEIEKDIVSTALEIEKIEAQAKSQPSPSGDKDA